MGNVCGTTEKDCKVQDETAEQHVGHGLGAVDNSQKEETGSFSEQSLQHGSASQMNKGSMKSTETQSAPKPKKFAKKEKRKSSKTDENPRVTKAKKVKTEDLNKQHVKTKGANKELNQKLQQKKNVEAETEQKLEKTKKRDMPAETSQVTLTTVEFKDGGEEKIEKNMAVETSQITPQTVEFKDREEERIEMNMTAETSQVTLPIVEFKNGEEGRIEIGTNNELVQKLQQEKNVEAETEQKREKAKERNMLAETNQDDLPTVEIKDGEEERIEIGANEELVQTLQQEKNLRAETEKELEKAKERLEKIEGETSTIKEQLAEADVEKSKMKTELAEKDSQIRRLEKVEGDTSTIIEQLAQANFENTKMKTELAEKERQIRRFEKIEAETSTIKEQLEEADVEKSKLKTELDEKDKQIRSNQERLSRTTSEISELNSKLASSYTERDKILTRLSELAGARLLDGNPNIADLSDMNRPTKLAEQYSELYDNEWTDAFSYLTEQGSLDESQTVKALLNILQTIYRVCQEKADEQIKTLHKFVSEFCEGSESPIEIKKHLKERRKKTYREYLPDLKKVIQPKLLKTGMITNQSLQAIAPYHDECLRICWLMCIQDPPVYVDCNTNLHGEKYSKDRFKTYTKAGQYIDFLVWPSVHLLKDGVTLFKGVVQGMQAKDDSFQTKNITVKPVGAISLPVGTTLESLMTSSASKVVGNIRNSYPTEANSCGQKINITKCTTKTEHETMSKENTTKSDGSTPENNTSPKDKTTPGQNILPEQRSASEDEMRPMNETPSEDEKSSTGNTPVDKETTKQGEGTAM